MAKAKHAKETRLSVIKTLAEATTDKPTPVLNISITDGNETKNITRYFSSEKDKQKYIDGFNNLSKNLNV
ncbi:hypothetical protein [Oceanobacillus halotolerans]|uniref:hypothetical protein n=1 Tax=Oceanobacillus halotolerans TaxID=2663380 RepID=UPI0013DCF630|nr:hypothetical protein [Oceanobacillus halotolerans]